MASSPLNFYHRLRSIAKLFRFIELFLVLVFLFWLFIRLPFAVKISGHYFRRFSALIVSPISIFLLGNAIVLTLLTKSGLFSGKASASIDNAVADLYDELRSGDSDDLIPPLEEEVVFQDKEIICEESAKTADLNVIHHDDQDLKISEKKHSSEILKVSYRRSQPKSLRTENDEREKQILQRSETDIRRKNIDETVDECSEDDLSNEEFQRTIEAFIAKQISFHRQERLAVVLHGQA